MWIFIPDLIMMDCDLLKHIDFMVDPAKNFVVNMKDCKIHKNTIKYNERERKAKMKRRSLLLVSMVLGLMLAMPLHMQRPYVWHASKVCR